MTNQVYLDYNATTPVKPEVIKAMAEALAIGGNPSSVHAAGRAARRLVAKARGEVAALVGVPPQSVIFTSGGTEANNQALFGADGPVIASAVEHPSIQVLASEQQMAPVDADGVIDLALLDQLIDKHRPARLALMLANNETGVIQPIREVGAIASKRSVWLHVDAVQAAGKIPVDLFDLGADTLSLSAHKFGGPQGIGALILRPGIKPEALMKGGGQEQRFRGGTENVPGIAGFGRAAALAQEDGGFAEHVEALRDRLEAEVLAVSPNARIFGTGARRLPNTSCFALPGLSHETQLIAFDLAGIAVSSGSACSSGKVGASPVLTAMGVPPEEAACAIRVSFGWNSQTSDVDRFIVGCRDLLGRRRLRQSA